MDGLRGFAVVAVMASHLFPGTPHSAISLVLVRVTSYGAMGVDLFFVLSGFLITGILFDSLQDPGYFKKFYARRALRIWPLYYGVLLVFAACVPFAGMHFNNQLWSMALYLQNTHVLTKAIYDYAGPSILPLAHFWSLAIEEQFYLVWPLVIFLFPRRRSLLQLCLVFILACPLLRIAFHLRGWTYYAVHTNTLLRADSLLSGAALALLLRTRYHDTALRLAGQLALLGVAGAVIVALTPSDGGGLIPLLWQTALSFRYSSLDLVSVGLIAVVLHPGVLASVFGTRWLRFLGKYSYGLYVLHLPIFVYLQKPLLSFIRMHLTESRGVSVFLAGSVSFVLSVAAAYASYHLYEKRFLQLKRFFAYRSKAPATT